MFRTYLNNVLSQSGPSTEPDAELGSETLTRLGEAKVLLVRKDARYS